MRHAFRRTTLMAAVLLLCGGSDDTVRFALPPTAPRPLAAGADTLFTDNFSAGLSRWQPDQPGVWSVRAGMLRADLPDERQERSLLYAGSEDWVDYALDFDVCMMRGVDKGAVVRIQGNTGVGVDLRGGAYQDVLMYLREWSLGKARALNMNAAWHHVRIEVNGTRFRVFINDELKLDRRDGRRPQGRIALAAYTGGVAECTVWYDNVRVTHLP